MIPAELQLIEIRLQKPIVGLPSRRVREDLQRRGFVLEQAGHRRRYASVCLGFGEQLQQLQEAGLGGAE